MIKVEIHSWLTSNRDYSEGLKILKKYSKSPLIRMLDSGEDPINKKKLAELLIEIENNLSLTEETPQKTTESISVLEGTTSDQKQEHLVFPPKLLRLINERKSLYAEVNYLKSKTPNCLEGEGLKDISFEILNRWDRIDEIWAIQDNFNRTGLMPLDPADILQEKYSDPVYLKKSQANLRSNISKIHSKIKKVGNDPAKVKELEKRLSEFKRELSVVESKLEDYEKKSV